MVNSGGNCCLFISDGNFKYVYSRPLLGLRFCNRAGWVRVNIAVKLFRWIIADDYSGPLLHDIYLVCKAQEAFRNDHFRARLKFICDHEVLLLLYLEICLKVRNKWHHTRQSSILKSNKILSFFSNCQLNI